MMKSVALAAAAVMGLASPVLAADAVTDGSAVRAHGAELADAYEARQAQKLLVSQGYTGVSEMERVANGRWIGTATKDGKTLIVGVNLSKPVVPASN